MSRSALVVLALFGVTILLGGWTAILVALRWPIPAAATGGLVAAALAAPWWVPGLLWLGAGALGLALLRPRPGAAAPPERISPTWRAPVPASAPPIVPASLNALLRPSRAVEAVAFRRTAEGGWEAGASASAPFRRLRVTVDYAPVPDTASGRNVGPARVEIASLPDVAPGQAIVLPILSADGSSWRLAGPEGDVLPPEPMHRCRLQFAADDRELQSVYFVLLPLTAGTRPLLVEEGAFRYRDTWEAEAPLMQAPRWRGR